MGSGEADIRNITAATTMSTWPTPTFEFKWYGRNEDRHLLVKDLEEVVKQLKAELDADPS